MSDQRGAGCGAGDREQDMGGWAAFDGAGFDAVGTVADTVGAAVGHSQSDQWRARGAVRGRCGDGGGQPSAGEELHRRNKGVRETKVSATVVCNLCRHNGS